MTHLAACYAKAAFATPRAADRVRRDLRRRKSLRLAVYRCPWCGKWHLGRGGRCGG